MTPNESKPESVAEVEAKQTIAHFGKVDYTNAQSMRFYANHAAASATLFDIRLILSDVDVKGENVQAIQTLTVLLSPEIAHILHLLLGKSLETYLKSYGAIRVPENIATAVANPKHEPPPAQ